MSLLSARTTRVKWPDLRDVLAGLPWAVCGAVATRLYMPERATADLDVLIHGDDRVRVQERLVAQGFVRLGGGPAWDAADRLG